MRAQEVWPSHLKRAYAMADNRSWTKFRPQPQTPPPTPPLPPPPPDPIRAVRVVLLVAGIFFGIMSLNQADILTGLFAVILIALGCARRHLLQRWYDKLQQFAG